MSGDDLFGDGPDGDGERAPSPFSGEAGGATERARAKIGRPAGARNRKSEAFERWFHARGYVDPLQRLAELVSEDPRVLQAWLDEHAGLDAEGNRRRGPPILEVIRMQIAAAGELAPYLHGKMPVKVEVEGTVLPVLAILTGDNQLDQARLIEQRKALSIGAPLPEDEANKINGLAEGE